MTAEQDGGPAFPSEPKRMHINEGGTAAPLGFYGMSLRDYFAGQALAGMSADPNIQGSWVEIADKAYFAADAMLKRRGE